MTAMSSSSCCVDIVVPHPVAAKCNDVDGSMIFCAKSLVSSVPASALSAMDDMLASVPPADGLDRQCSRTWFSADGELSVSDLSDSDNKSWEESSVSDVDDLLSAIEMITGV